MNEVYLVTIDGWMDGYGFENYALGAFDTLEDAQNAIDQIDILVEDREHAAELKRYAKITKFKKNVILQIRPYRVNIPGDDHIYEYATDAYLGGYCE